VGIQASSCADTRLVEASFAGDLLTAEFVVCTLAGLEYKTGDMTSYAPVDRILMALPSIPVHFTALIAPSGASWPGVPPVSWPAAFALSPEVKPQWAVATTTGQSAAILRAASSSQGTVQVTFSAPTENCYDDVCCGETVQAECGGAALARVIVIGGLRLVPERNWVEVGRDVTVRAVRANGGSIEDVSCSWGSDNTAQATVGAGPSTSATVHGVAASDPMGVRISASHPELGAAAVRLTVVAVDRLEVSEDGESNAVQDTPGSPNPGTTLYVPAARQDDLRLYSLLHMSPNALYGDTARSWRLDAAAGGSTANWAPVAGDFADTTHTLARFHLPASATSVPASDRDTVLTGWLDSNGNGSADTDESVCQVAVKMVDIVKVTAKSVSDPSRTADATDAAPGELYMPFLTDAEGNSVTTASVFALSSCLVAGVSQWPSGRPLWSLTAAGGSPGVDLGGWDGTKGGLYTFPSPGVYAFRAECGNTVLMTVNVVKVDIVGHLPAALPGEGATPVSEADEDTPLNLMAAVNDNRQENPADPDNADTTVVGTADTDLVRLTLNRVDPALVTGIVELSVSPSSDVRVFVPAGTTVSPLTDWSVNLVAPSGQLAGLATGPVDVFLEGLAPNADVTVTLTYRRGADIVTQDNVHMALVKVDLVGHHPGTVVTPGSVISEADEEYPLKLLAKVNDDLDEGGPNPDNADNTVAASDDDIVKLTLRRLDPALTTGTMALSVSPALAVRVFSQAGGTIAPLADWSVDLAAPTGDLAALVSGDVDMLVEGLQPSADVTVTLQYSYAGRGVCADTVRMTILRVESVEICKPDAGAWDALPWGQVLLAGQELKLKVRITPGASALACSPDAALRTFTVNSSGTETTIHDATVTITPANSTLQGTDEIRVTVPAADVLSLNLAAKAEDSATEKCSADSKSVTTGASHRRDSDAFDANAPGDQRGLARDGGDIGATPPEGEYSKTFLQAAGALCIDATVGGVKSEKRQIQEQSDVFYYSGHGSHATAMLGGLAGPSDVKPHWDDIDKAIIAGCAVLDVNDYNNRYPEDDHTASPGKQWAATAPDYLLGYNWKAPLDDNVGDPDFTKDIIEGYLSSSLSGDVNKWMWANRSKAAADFDDFDDPGQRPWNACLLTRGATGWTYWYWDFSTLDADGKPMLNHKQESEW
jgi:hypothetical protein